MNVKDTVLEALLQAEGNLSGEELAGQLGISRNSVWKAIEQLRRDGYRICAAPNRGYVLEHTADRLSEPVIRQYMCGPAWKLSLYDRLDSTNTQAKKLALAGFEHRTVILADTQSSGKGRLGRSFCSPPGSGIYMSLLFHPRGDVQNAVLGTTYAAVAVARAIERFCPTPVEIKWVNDLYMGGKKICGILTEAGMNFETGGLDYMVIGIGINVRHVDFPRELREIAGTVEDLSGQVISRAALIAAILDEMGDVESGFDRHYMKEYRRRSLILGKTVTVLTGQSQYDALAVDIDDDAALIVEADGLRRRINAGEVSIRNWAR